MSHDTFSDCGCRRRTPDMECRDRHT